MEFRRRYGAYETPTPIVDLMLRLTGIEDFRGLRVLEPACGMAPFSYAVSRLKGGWEGIVGVEVDEKAAERVKERYPELEVRVGDYLLMEFPEKFDLIVGNPPYGIIGSETHYAISPFRERKGEYKRHFHTWLGKYNIYGLFIEKSIKILRDHGTLCFIIPATWMILDEFKKLRCFLASSCRLNIYYLGRGVFRGLSVSTVILVAEKGGCGLALYDVVDGRPTLNHMCGEYDGGVIAFKTGLTEALESKAYGRLEALFEIRISPRSTEVKSTPYLSRERMEGYIPILSGRNLKSNQIDYEKCYSGYYISYRDVGRLRSYFLKDRVVVGHTKGGRLISAIDHKHYAWTGDVYHLIPRDEESQRLLQDTNYILNSKLMNRYMREKYRDITPHTTKTQLKHLPLIHIQEFRMLEQTLI